MFILKVVSIIKRNVFDLHFPRHYIFGLDIPREKLVLGLAGYGRSMMLSDPKCTYDGCPISGEFVTS